MELVDRDVPGPKRDLVGYGRHAPRVRWPDGGRVCVSICLNYEEGSEYSKAAGDTRNEGQGELDYVMEPKYRDFAVESVYEYGSRAGVWRLQRLFDRYRIPITVFAAAVALERNREVGAWIREAGHEPCSHGWRWEEVWRLSPEEERARIRVAVESITKTCGQRPVGWYCRYNPSPLTRQLLVEEGGFLYDSDAYNDDLPYHVDVQGTRHLVVPYTLTYNDFRFVWGQGYGTPADFTDYLWRGLEYLWEEGETHPRMMSIGLHARWTGQAARAAALRDFIERALAKGQVWFARRADIAHWWNEHHTEFVP